MFKTTVIDFPEVLQSAANGRNGYMHVHGVMVQTVGRKVEVEAVNSRGAQGACVIGIMPESCGELARNIAEAGASLAPEMRSEIAEQLRAALIAIENGFLDDIDDGFSEFGMTYR